MRRNGRAAVLLTIQHNRCEETVVTEHKNEPSKKPERPRREQSPEEGKDRASNPTSSPASGPERPLRQDPQFDPNHINES